MNETNKTIIIIGQVSSTFGLFGAITCSVLGTLLNLLVLIVILTRAKVRRYNASPLMFYHSLSLLTFSALCLPVAAMRFYFRDNIFKHLPEEGCSYFSFVFFANLAVSNWIVSIVSLNNYLLAVREWSWLNWGKSSACFVGLWIVSGTFLSLPMTQTWGKLGHEEETFSCTITSYDGKERSTKNPVFFLMILGIIVPLIVITVSLVGLLYEVKKKFRGSIVRKNSKLKETGRIMEAQINNRIGMVCGTFVALQMPAFLVLALDPMPPSTLDGLHIIAIVLAWCPTFVNPIVYFYLDNKFYRRELKNWFRELGEWRPRQKKHSLGMQNGKLWIDRRNIISTLPGDTTISTLPFNQ